jgi:hypothetical protein
MNEGRTHSQTENFPSINSSAFFQVNNRVTLDQSFRHEQTLAPLRVVMLKSQAAEPKLASGTNV